MAVKIGCKYEETKARLQKEILDKTISFLVISPLPVKPNFGCYFCRKHIDNLVVILTKEENVNDKEINSFYPLHFECFHKAKTNFYVNGLAYSVN